MKKFQSTLPVRGATAVFFTHFALIYYFNPRSPCGERQCCQSAMMHKVEFQSTLPVRGATQHWLSGNL